MSIEHHSPPSTGSVCDVVKPDTALLPCAHDRMVTVVCVDHREDPSDDPAVLIGLTLAFARQGALLCGLVPEPLMLRLGTLADDGNAACRLVLDWLRTRSRSVDRLTEQHMPHAIPDVVSPTTQRLRRSPGERVRAACVPSGSHDGQKRGRVRPRDPVQNAQTAIIAAETGGGIDG